VYSDAPAAFGKEAAKSLAAFAEQATTSLFLLGRLQAQRSDTAYVTAFSHTIQASLRTVLPEVAGLELSGGSIASAPHAAVGGDWYDAFVLLDGSVGLVIGDVMGHGIEAVTAMAQVRTMVRTAAVSGLDPADVLRVTDELADQSGISETVTVFYANLHMEKAGMSLRYCNAGHPNPLLRTPEGEVTELKGGKRPLIGAIVPGAPNRLADVGTCDLAPNSLLLLYTDGLVEGRGRDENTAAAGLRERLAALGPEGSLEELCDQLLDPPNAKDDTTVFAIRIRGEQPT
jgi:serine phosphatase RsbU (regulator of sigma subunit)